jgi:hypothetical protein
MNSLSFTVTNATIAGLETANAAGNIFVADILCGATVTGCAGQTGPVDASTPTPPVPIPGTAWLFGTGLVGLGLLGRRKLKAQATA